MKPPRRFAHLRSVAGVVQCRNWKKKLVKSISFGAFFRTREVTWNSWASVNHHGVGMTSLMTSSAFSDLGSDGSHLQSPQIYPARGPLGRELVSFDSQTP